MSKQNGNLSGKDAGYGCSTVYLWRLPFSIPTGLMLDYMQQAIYLQVYYASRRAVGAGSRESEGQGDRRAGARAPGGRGGGGGGHLL